MRTALFIYNPVAGRIKLRSDIWDIISVLGEKYQLIVRGTQKSGDGKEIIKENQNELFDAIICCGGDGTLNEVINGMLEYDITVPLGYIPCGSTNDFAKSIRLPITPREAALNIIKDNTSPIDIGLFDNEKHFSYIASFGVFTSTSYSTPQKEKNFLGHFAYILRAIKEVHSLKKCPTYKTKVVTEEGETFEGEFIFGGICNSTSMGGFMKLPDSEVNMSDGLFEALFISKPKKTKEWFSLLNDISHKKILSNPLVYSCKTHIINIEMPKTNWSIDGEKFVGGERITIKNKKQAIEFLI